MQQGRKFSPLSILLVTFVGVPILSMASCLAYTAFQARRPKDMPNAIWIDAPAVPFGFYRGSWESCWLEPDQRTNHCRLYARGSVVYEGRFMPCGSNQPVPMSELKLRAPKGSEEMWLFTGFVVFLQNGRVLVPIDDVGDCAKIDRRFTKEGTLQLKETD